MNSKIRFYSASGLVFFQTISFCAISYAQENKSTGAAEDSLGAQAITLQKQAAKLDLSMRQFDLHAQAYKRSRLHSRVMAQLKTTTSKHDAAVIEDKLPLTPEQAAAQKQMLAIPKLSASQLDARIQTVHELHEEYEMHVTQLQGLVDQYRDFVKAYLDHYNQFKLGCDQSAAHVPLKAEQADMATPGTTLYNLAAAEKHLSSVLSKMQVLEKESPHLSESYLCPAYDDLQHQFVQALQVLTTTIEAVPLPQRQAVVQVEMQQIERLKTEFMSAEALHGQQKSLQTEIVGLRKSYAEIFAKNQLVQAEAVKDDERTRTIETLIERQDQRRVLEKVVPR